MNQQLNMKGDDYMNEAAKEARRAYRREWQRKNPDKVRAYQERYWSRKAAEKQQSDLQDQNPVCDDPTKQ